MSTANNVTGSDTGALISKYLFDKHIRVDPEWTDSLVQHLEREGQTGGISTEVCELAVLHFLNSDIQLSLDTAESLLLPQAKHDDKLTIKGPLILQIVSCQEIGSSLSSQLEALDAYEERLKPLDRRLVLPTGDEVEFDLDTTNRANEPRQSDISMDILVPKKTCRLLLEDAAGNRCYALEQKPIPEIKIGMSLGAKLVVQDVLFVLGVMMLRPYKCTFLGGSVAHWQGEASLTGIRDQLKTKLAQEYSDIDSVSIESDLNLGLQAGTHNSTHAERQSSLRRGRQPRGRSRSTGGRSSRN